MSTFRGCEGVIKFNNGGGLQTVVEVTSIELGESSNIKQYKTIGGDCTDKTKDLGKSYTLNVEGNYCADDAGQVQLDTGSLLAFEYWPGGDAVPATDPLFSGNIRISELTRSASPDEDVTFSMSSIGDGALTKTNTW